MRTLIALLIFIAFGDVQESIPYGPGQCLSLRADEKIIETTQRLVDYYDPFHGVESYQIPIHKCIAGKSHTTYFGIGVGFDADQKLLFDAYLNDNSYQVLDSRKINDRSTGMWSYQIFCKKGDLYNHKYIFTIAEPLMTLVVNDVSADSLVIAKLYHDENYIQTRRNCEKK